MPDTDGILSKHTDSVDGQVMSIAKRRDRIESHLTAIKSRYRLQLAALDQMIARMSKTDCLLQQQLVHMSEIKKSGR